MSVGLGGNITVNQKKKAAGAPFPAGSAAEGVSVDALSGQIVLGDDVAQGTNNSQLHTDRGIDFNGFFSLFFSANGIVTFPGFEGIFFSPGARQMGLVSSIPGTVPKYILTDLTSGSNARLQFDGVRLFMGVDNGFGSIQIIRATGELLMTDNSLFVPNGAKLQVDGDVTTSQPSANGSGKWKLGKVVAGAVAADAANFVEVEIDGVIVKLIKAV